MIEVTDFDRAERKEMRREKWVWQRREDRSKLAPIILATNRWITANTPIIRSSKFLGMWNIYHWSRLHEILPMLLHFWRFIIHRDLAMWNRKYALNWHHNSAGMCWVSHVTRNISRYINVTECKYVLRATSAINIYQIAWIVELWDVASFASTTFPLM